MESGICVFLLEYHVPYWPSHVPRFWVVFFKDWDQQRLESVLSLNYSQQIACTCQSLLLTSCCDNMPWQKILQDSFLLAYGTSEISPLQCQAVAEADRHCPRIKKLRVHILNNKYTMRHQGISHQKALWLGVKCSWQVKGEESARLWKWKFRVLMTERDLVSITPNVCPFIWVTSVRGLLVFYEESARSMLSQRYKHKFRRPLRTQQSLCSLWSPLPKE